MHPCHIRLDVPPLAFSCLKIKQGDYRCSELLAGHKRDCRFAIGEPFATDIPANGAVIWKLLPVDTEKKVEEKKQKND